jgi:hypothetical protein
MERLQQSLPRQDAKSAKKNIFIQLGVACDSAQDMLCVFARVFVFPIL